MYAVLVDEKQNLNWTEVPDPVAGENEVLIEIHAAALNRADLLQRAGKYPPPPGWPEWMGLEVAGSVLSAPADSRWKKGDKVCALLGGGGYFGHRAYGPAGLGGGLGTVLVIVLIIFVMGYWDKIKVILAG